MRNLEQSLTPRQSVHCYGGSGPGQGLSDALCAELKMYVNLIWEISTSFVNHLHIHTLNVFVDAGMTYNKSCPIPWHRTGSALLSHYLYIFI